MRSHYATQTLVLIALGSVASGAVRGDYRDSPIIAARKAALNSRITKRFDFDERKLGNYEAMPMNWRQLVEPGYPRFLEPGFDDERGHDSAPSFHFPLRNGNLGAYYLARDIPVDAESAYRITAWIRPRRLKHGAAFLTAGYLGQNLKLMRQTEQRSAYIRGEGDEEPWTCITINLPGGIQNARCITLSCRVEQNVPVDPNAAPLPTDLTYHDVEGEAWFDDITIIRMPRTVLELGDPQGVFESNTTPQFRVSLRDFNCAGLTLRIELFNADDRKIDEREIDPHAAFCWPVAYEPPSLAPGLYTARLTVDTGAEAGAVEFTQRRFLVLAQPRVDRVARSKNIGVILNDSVIQAPGALDRLSDLIGAGVAKIGIWRGGMDDKAVVVGGTSHEKAASMLAEKGIELVGVIDDAPATLAAQYPPDRRSLVDILASDPSQWKPYLALVLTRFSTRMQYWQLGPDSAAIPENLPLLREAIAELAGELDHLTTRTPLAIPVSPRLDPALHPAGGQISAFIQTAGDPAMHFVDQLTPAENPAEVRWATIRPLDAARYDRTSALTDFAKAMIESRSRGFNIVFTDAPWTVRLEHDTPIIEPNESFMLLRTLSLELSGLTNVESVHVAPGVQARLFSGTDGLMASLVLWTEGSPERPVKIRLETGSMASLVDLWGNRRALQHFDDGFDVSVGSMPSLISPVDARLVRLSSSFVLDEPVIAPVVDVHHRVMTFTNTMEARLTGRIRVTGPTGWRINPAQAFVDVNPGQSARIPIQIQLPANQSAGEFELIGRMQTQGAAGDDLTLRAQVIVDMPGLDVNVLSYRDDDKMRVVQRVTNRTKAPVNLRASLTSPGMPRQWRSIPSLPPGESVIRNFELLNPEQLAGKSIRVSVEQVGGPLRHNKLIRFE